MSVERHPDCCLEEILPELSDSSVAMDEEVDSGEDDFDFLQMLESCVMSRGGLQ